LLSRFAIAVKEDLTNPDVVTKYRKAAGHLRPILFGS